ncbi:MAG TPA: M20/M25/M40 family metallo-hydrolase [Candidatus Lokiarchaeia archaeon]|nr:M20/M25/M40 family metallo-hydrolase [Candidatus Lokiarchaeia archaeon]
MTPEISSMMEFIKSTCDKIGPRLGTGEAEQKAGIKIKELLGKYTDDVSVEPFECHPGGFLDFIKIAFIASVVATILFFWIPFLSAILLAYAITTFIFEQMHLKEYVDFLFPKRKGENIAGKLMPTGETKKVIIISGHHDSAYEFPLFAKYKHNFGKLAYTTAGILIVAIVVSIIKFILDLMNLSTITSNIILLCFPFASVVLGGYIAFNLHSKNVILGANDNLSGVAIVLAIADYFSENRLDNTTLWLVSFSCEECMRGSKRFVEKHINELKDVSVINFDMVGRGNISIDIAEPEYTTKHSIDLATAFHESSKKTGSEIPMAAAKFGGTDAAFFSKKKIDAISIVGLTPQQYPDSWHELSDTPENLKPECLERALAVTIQYIKDVDAALQ